MPKESTNLKLKLYNAATDAAQLAKTWFNDIFDYSNSNWVKIDDAYKALSDAINSVKNSLSNFPTKTGSGASGTWNINITGSSGSTKTASTADRINFNSGNEVNFNGTPTNKIAYVGYRDTAINEYRFCNGTGNTLAKVSAASFEGEATMASAAKKLRQGNGNADMVFNWDGSKGGQPAWVWGGDDGINMYVYNPSNFGVAYAANAGNSSSVNGYKIQASSTDLTPGVSALETNTIYFVYR